MQNGASIVKAYSALGCSGKSGNVWTGGTNGIAGRHDGDRRRDR